MTGTPHPTLIIFCRGVQAHKQSSGTIGPLCGILSKRGNRKNRASPAKKLKNNTLPCAPNSFFSPKDRLCLRYLWFWDPLFLRWLGWPSYQNLPWFLNCPILFCCSVAADLQLLRPFAPPEHELEPGVGLFAWFFSVDTEHHGAKLHHFTQEDYSEQI